MKPHFRIAAPFIACVLAACGVHGNVVPISQTVTPASERHVMVCSNIAAMHAQLLAVNPHRFGPSSMAPPPMPRTAMLPASAMHSPANRRVDGMLSWTQIPGTASQVAAAADGTLWSGNNSLYVLSDQPSGSADKYIWHYYYQPASGTTPAGWTWANIPGRASQIAVSPYSNTLFAVNSSGGVYAYCSGNWSSLAGGARSVAVDLNGFIYVASNNDGAIWEYPGGSWLQLAGSGTTLAGTWDPTSYVLPGSSVISSGVYILNAQGEIWHENPDQSFAYLPGAASGIAPVTGGVLVLGNPPNSNGSPLYYYSYATNAWSSEPGAATSISSDGTDIYAIGTSGAIYETTTSGL